MPTTPTQVIDRLKLTADALQGFNETIGGATVAHRLLTNAAKDVIGYSAIVSVAGAGGNTTTGIYHLGGITLADTNTAPLQLTSAGRLIVDGSQATQPVSGTVAVTGVATATNQTNLTGPVAPGAAAANSVLTGAVYNTAAPAPTNGQQVALQMDSSGRLIVSAANVTGTVAPGSAAGAAMLTAAKYTAAGVTLTDGQQAALQTDAAGNLRTNEIDALTGTLSASSAAVMTGMGSSGVITCAGYRSVSFQVTANPGNNTITVEISNDGGVSWGALTAGQNTAATSWNPTFSGTSAIPWQASLIGAQLRCRISSYTSGTTTLAVVFKKSTLTQTLIAQSSGQPGYTALMPRNVSSNGPSNARLFSANTTNATSVKGSAGNLYSLTVSNTVATVCYIKLYDKASAPTVGSDTPIATFPVPASTLGIPLVLRWEYGLAFTNGIAYAMTNLLADADATAVASAQLTGQLQYA